MDNHAYPPIARKPMQDSVFSVASAHGIASQWQIGLVLPSLVPRRRGGQSCGWLSDSGKGSSDPRKHESCPIPAIIREDLRFARSPGGLAAATTTMVFYQPPSA